MSERRTKRRFAHELFPPADEGRVRPLSVEVPYLYAHFIGLDSYGTSWLEVDPEIWAARRTKFTDSAFS